MVFGANTTAVLVIIFAIIIVTVANNIISEMRAEEATRQREDQLKAAVVVQNDIEDFEQNHQEQTQQLVDMLALGVERQDELIAKLDQALNQNSSSSSS